MARGPSMRAQGKSDGAQRLLTQMTVKTPIQRNELSYVQG